jgi:hypothetical protein
MKKIPLCTICGSHSSVDEDSSLLVYYSELIGKLLLMCQSSMLPTSKGKGVSVHVMKVYGENEEKLHSFRTSLPVGFGWLALCPGIFNPVDRPPAPIPDASGCFQKPV